MPLDPATSREHLTYRLTQWLYQYFYCLGGASPFWREMPRTAAFADSSSAAFARALSQKNTSGSCRDDDWFLEAIIDGRRRVRKNGLHLILTHNGQPSPAATAPCVGKPMEVILPPEFRRITPGFYMALGSRGLSDWDLRHLLRIYINPTPQGALLLMAELTARLNERRIPFRYKVFLQLRRFTRCDASVLYVSRRDYLPVWEVLSEISSSIFTHIRPQVPALTKEVAPGIGLAESPPDGASFGLHRCRLVAEGLIHGAHDACRSLEDRYGVVNDYLARHGVDAERPYLEPGSSDQYALAGRSGHGNWCSSVPGEVDGGWLEAAAGIGHAICSGAIWDGRQCTWIASAPDRYRTFRDNYAPLGFGLYSGTAGIALFLGQLAAKTGDQRFRRVALGALEHALAKATDMEPPQRSSLHEGLIGIALIVFQVARLLGAGELLPRARRLVEGIDRCEGFDIVTGRAGTIIGFLCLAAGWRRPNLRMVSETIGDELLALATHSNGGVSWVREDEPQDHHLLGMAHGASGAAYALLELYRSSRQSRFLDTAVGALEYEQTYFVPELNNWPDFRGHKARSRTWRRPGNFMTYWCHGAPGIALTRVRAYEITSNEEYREQALRAMDCCRAMIEATLSHGMATFCLCHGLAGNADVLLECARTLGSNVSEIVKVAREVGSVGLAMYARDRSWPCGVPYGYTPGFMTGWAGIGYFYLRLADHRIPSILAPLPDAFRAEGSRPSTDSTE
jgi:hypothetical protein